MSILRLSLGDFFLKQCLKLNLIPFAVSFIAFVLMCVFLYGFLFDYFISFVSTSSFSFISWLYSFAFIQILSDILSFFLALFVITILSLFLALLLTAFLSPFIVAFVNSKHYQYEPKEAVSNFKVIGIFLFVFLKFFLALMLCLFFIFVPFLNMLLLHIAFYYLFHKSLILDVSSIVLDKQNFLAFYSKTKPLEFKFSTLCFYILSLVPFFGLFLQSFFVIFLAHLLYQRILGLECKKG